MPHDALDAVEAALIAAGWEWVKRDPYDDDYYRRWMHELPPLIKGYLRLGAFIGDGAVIDHQFGTTDVLIVLPVSAINARYLDHFGVDGSRHAA